MNNKRQKNKSKKDLTTYLRQSYSGRLRHEAHKEIFEFKSERKKPPRLFEPPLLKTGGAAKGRTLFIPYKTQCCCF
jgi:hypothetical protein